MTVATAPARTLALSRIPLTILAGILWLLGWTAGKVWSAVTWVGVAVKVGWSDARTTPQRR